jgi:hypothetical protein
MLHYNNKRIDNARPVGSTTFSVPNFLQMILQIEPTTCRNNVLRLFEDKTANHQALSEQTLPKKLSTLPTMLGYDRLRTITAVYLDGREEAFSDLLNRFSGGSDIILLYLGPDPRAYCTRETNFVIRPGELVVIRAQTNVIYTKAYLALAVPDCVIPGDKGLTIVYS